MNEQNEWGMWLEQTYWQDLYDWIDQYFQQNVGVTLMDGELTASEQALVESWASSPSNVYHYVQSLYSQSFFADYLATLPGYEADPGWQPDDLSQEELADLDSQWADLFAGLFGSEFDSLFDDLLDGPPYSQQLSQKQVEDMALLYEAALGRGPDGPGLNYFVGNLREGQSLQDVARSFYQAPEFRGQFEEFDDTSYINQLYENVLNRQADQAGLDYWINDIQNNGRSHADVLVSFAQSEENRDNAGAWLSGLQFDTNTDEWIL